MRENRTSYPLRKARMYQQIQEMPKRYSTVALIRMNKVRASQILSLRKIMHDDVEFASIKDKVAQKALEALDTPGMSGLIPHLTEQCMLAFTNLSPFMLTVMLDRNKIMMAARGGDVASMDVVVTARNTGIAPGPMLTEFKDAGIPTKIDQGTIWIAKDTTPVRKGEEINDKLASLLTKLDIKPIEAGITLYAAVEDGRVYSSAELVVDVEAFREALVQAHQESVTLSVEAGYATPDNILQILAKASQSAQSLCAESGFMTAETKEMILQKAHAHAQSIVRMAKGYTPA